MILKFIDRDDELKFLEERFKGNRPEFIIIYGRRRIGKTELINQFIKNKTNFYFLAKKQDLKLELSRFVRKFGKKFNTFIEAESYEELFEKIVEFFGKQKRFIIVVDEFSYWLEKDETIASTFQLIWDEILKHSKCFLILCGSLVGMMESLFSYKNPLYGRRTGQWKVTPLKFLDVRKFFPKYTLEDVVKVYACVGGIPQYLLEFDPTVDVMENIKGTFFRRGNILYEDGERILADELREPIVYLNIMECVNEGSTTFSEISGKTGVGITNLSKYMKTLCSMDLITKEFPVDAGIRKSKRGVYKIVDNYFKFWLRFVYPYRDEIESQTYDFSSFEREFNKYIGLVFEDIAKEFLVEMNRRKHLPLTFKRIGKWWYKDTDIDLMMLNEKTKQIAFFEVKWHDFRSFKEAIKILEKLKEKSKCVRWFNEERKEYFGLVAKKIKKRVKNKLIGEDYLVWDLMDFQKLNIKK